jgi:hypothetical protein
MISRQEIQSYGCRWVAHVSDLPTKFNGAQLAWCHSWYPALLMSHLLPVQISNLHNLLVTVLRYNVKCYICAFYNFCVDLVFCACFSSCSCLCLHIKNCTPPVLASCTPPNFLRTPLVYSRATLHAFACLFMSLILHRIHH